MAILSSRRIKQIVPSLLALIFTTLAGAQMLARPGWAGSGMSSTLWWKRPIVYRADPHLFSGLRGVADHMDYVHSLGVDAMLVSAPSNDAKQPFDPALGTLDDFDEIVRRASQYNIRVLAELNPQADLNAATRLWLVHGVAGFYAPGASSAQLAAIRHAASGFGGQQRIVIGDLASLDDTTARTGETPQLVVDPRTAAQDKLTASTTRPSLEAAQQLVDQGRTVPLLLSDRPGLKRSFTRFGDGTHDTEIAKLVAAMLLTTRAPTMLFSGQELGLANSQDSIVFGEPKKGEQPPPGTEAAGNATGSSLLNWYRQLIALGHSNRTISSGAISVLNHDDQNVLAWVRRPASASPANPPIIVVANLSAQPVTVSLKADIQKLHLRGSFLRTVLRTDNAMGAMHLDGMTLQPYMVFIGELRY